MGPNGHKTFLSKTFLYKKKDLLFFKKGKPNIFNRERE